MSKKILSKSIATKNSVREVCIDSTEDVWVKIRIPAPSTLMEFERRGLGNDTSDSFELISTLITDHLVEPKIVAEATDVEGQLTLDELGSYFLPIGTAILDSLDPTGDARKKAESFLENGSSNDGSDGGKDIPHATVNASEPTLPSN